MRLAASLRGEVVAAESELPARFRSPLLIGVGALTRRLSCIPPPVTVQPPPQRPHGHQGNGNGNGGDNGNGNGGENNGGGD
jgi:hypothetical protein